MSVTSRRNEIRRDRKRWQEMVDPHCQRFLQVYGEARRLMPSSMETDFSSYVSAKNPAEEIFKQHPELAETREVVFQPEFIQMVKDIPGLNQMVGEGKRVGNKRTADILEMTQDLALLSLQLSPEMKVGLYFWLGLWIVVFKDFLANLREMEYGREPLDGRKIANLAAQFLEILAQLCRGRVAFPKGRVNTELVHLVKLIREHQTGPLSLEQLREALAAAGISVPEGDAWRKWLWWAKRARLIPADPYARRHLSPEAKRHKATKNHPNP